eukprot:CAMPEP_0202055744 /NCGR_PEP_ID=MMETSP0963-20130614/20153_1 /ASSEMBLY_ACC=CAM_ASM_000494 /TAXON_ID=4773 /ORGANISM="Schizochytrium aggregatum, Strain ATCC28209" /LENGTH=44 /DNA_ID= /DNA_START= /DNA_END= /DNA_ORIENTATION=
MRTQTRGRPISSTAGRNSPDHSGGGELSLLTAAMASVSSSASSA